MELAVHLPVSLIANLISRTLGGQTRLELCKFHQYADLDSVFAVPYRGLRSQFMGATGAGFMLVAPEHRKPAYHGWSICNTLHYLDGTLDAAL